MGGGGAHPRREIASSPPTKRNTENQTRGAENEVVDAHTSLTVSRPPEAGAVATPGGSTYIFMGTETENAGKALMAALETTDESMAAGGGAGAAAAGQNRFAVSFEGRRKQKNRGRRGRKQRVAPKSRDWILNKKDRQRRQGKKVRRDTKFSGRKRRDKF